MAIYTKKGDYGETSLFDQKVRVSKDSLRIGAIGVVDEINSYLGIISSHDSGVGKILEGIQKNLFRIGAILAGAKLRLSVSETRKLEKQIDKLEGNLPVLRNFILPGGSRMGAEIHYARTLIRRAERKVVALSNAEKIGPQILTYLNRLSDYLFMLARKVNYEAGVREEIWKKGK